MDAHLKGDVYTAISKCFTLSRTAVCWSIAKCKVTHCVRNKPKCGCKHKISKTFERNIFRYAMKNPGSLLRPLWLAWILLDLRSPKKTVLRAVPREKLQGHLPRKPLLLMQQQIKARLKFAQNHPFGTWGWILEVCPSACWDKTGADWAHWYRFCLEKEGRGLQS